MRKSILLIIAIASSQLLFGQITDNKAIRSIPQDEQGSGMYAIPGSQHPLLIAKEKKLAEYYKQNPEARNLSLKKPTAWGFNVGDTHTWWADYFEEQDNGDEQYQVPSTCRAVGTNCYVFVEDGAWGSQVDQAAVDAVVTAFDSNIYPTDTATFGAPPNVDNDPRIIILILDIIDGWDGGGYVAGYFYSANEQSDPAWTNPSSGWEVRSNVAEIFYMDCNPADPINDPIGVFGTTAHEFQHMIHYNYGDEMTFVDEGLSEIASYICGYGIRSNGLYAQDTNVNLFEWDNGERDVLADYSRAAAWTLYLYEQFPNTTILQDFVNNQHSIVWDIDETLRGVDPSRGFYSVLLDWWIANYTNGKSNDPKYNYDYSPRTKPTPAATHFGNSGIGSGVLQPLAAEYITFTNNVAGDLSITFTGDNVVKIKALKIGSLAVEDVTKGVAYSPTGYGTTYPEVTFLVYNESPGASYNYSYVAVGTGVNISMELAYEDGVSDGTFGHVTGDSMAVIFTGVSGARLDSIKTYHVGTGKIRVDISKWTGGFSPIRGTNMFRSTPPANIDVTNSEAWHKIDLTSENLDATDDFVVSYLVGNDPSNPNIGVRSMDDTGFAHSRTFDGSNWWWYYDDRNTSGTYDSGDGAWNYLVRAYVSIGDLAIELDPSGIVSKPEEFSLGTNYPNPFNPSTTFDFAVPSDGLVKFTVYDLLGRIIYSENRNLLAGKYAFTWDGQNSLAQQVVSGVYFLKMEADGFSQTRKMLMMK